MNKKNNKMKKNQRIKVYSLPLCVVFNLFILLAIIAGIFGLFQIRKHTTTTAAGKISQFIFKVKISFTHLYNSRQINVNIENYLIILVKKLRCIEKL